MPKFERRIDAVWVESVIYLGGIGADAWSVPVDTLGGWWTSAIEGGHLAYAAEYSGVFIGHHILKPGQEIVCEIRQVIPDHIVEYNLMVYQLGNSIAMLSVKFESEI